MLRVAFLHALYVQQWRPFTLGCEISDRYQIFDDIRLSIQSNTQLTLSNDIREKKKILSSNYGFVTVGYSADISRKF